MGHWLLSGDSWTLMLFTTFSTREQAWQMPFASICEAIVIEMKSVYLQAADTSFLYFQRDFLQSALNSLYHSPGEAHKLPHLIAAFLDSGRILRHAGASTEDLWQASL